MIEFLNLDITSFKSIFHCYIDFENLQQDLYLLEGKNNTTEFAASNGSGKSTLISALVYALYGSTEITSVKKSDFQNKNTNIKLKLVLNLKIQDILYRIERTNDSFILFKNDENISELNKTETEKKFQDILGLTKSEFCSFTYLAQNGSGSFLTKTPSEKLSCIKDFIFSEDLLKLQNKIKNLLNNTKEQRNKKEKEYLILDSSVCTLEKVLLNNSKIEEKINLPYTLEEYKQQLQEMKKQKTEYEKLLQEKQNAYRQLENLKQKVRKIKSDYIKLVENICPTCGQKLQNNDLMLELTEQAKQVKQQILDTQSNIQNINSNFCFDNLDFDYEIENIQKCIFKLEKENNKIDVDSINKEIEDKKISMLNIEKEKDYLDFKLQQLNKLDTYFKTDFINYIQQAFLSEIENYLNLYCYDVFSKDYKLLFSKNSLDILIGDQPISYYSGGEQQRLNIVFLFAIKIALFSLINNKSTNLLILDESLSGSDSEAFDNTIEILNRLTKSENLTTILVSHKSTDYNINRIQIERYNNKTKLKIIEGE